jgi:hypothetical protein
MGRNYLQAIEHQYTVGLVTKGGRSTRFSHGLVSTRCNLCEECLRRYEFELTHHKTACSCLLQHPIGKQVQKFLCPYLQ